MNQPAVQAQSLSADLETVRISSQKHDEELADLKQQLAVLKSDLDNMRVRSEKYQSIAVKFKQERNDLRDELTRSLAQHQSQAAPRIAVQQQSRSQNVPLRYQGEFANLTRELRLMKSSNTTLDARLQHLMKERAEAEVTIKDLCDARDAQASSQGTSSLDSFQDVADQVSEDYVSFTGYPSVERLNDAIDNMVLEALEQACEVLSAQGDFSAHFAVKPPPSDTLLFASLAKRSLTEEDRGFLLDACLHSLVVLSIYDMFFQSTISTIAVDDEVEILDKVFSKITAAEPWAICQRWRAMAASATARMFEPADLEGQAHHIEEQVSRSIAWAYGQHATTFHPIRAKLLQNITAVMHDAHELSLVLKRDILSVRVMAALRHRGGPYDPQFEDSVWPEMGAQAGDRVIGVYGLGLQKVTPAGDNVAVVKPKVITSALLREIEKER
ncbi:hypothetical protein FIBSPDRAFT_846797 [Athelia psychrophila]|uniref:Uncharacterized protein n=1 Tax=Athelia psychrophila TaxID=1759441 RepID=A0A166XDS3_9AGAM|nr:hypothetical protein FIBSPDRAFT_846797 [Fibularhizoctonia sp. CBS 109695]